MNRGFRKAISSHPGEPDRVDLMVFDTHPIQYRSPLFVELARGLKNFKVYFFDRIYSADRFWFNEPGTVPHQRWDLPLTEGFESKFLEVSSIGLWKFNFVVRNLLRASRPSAVLMYGYALPENWIVWWWCRRLKIPIIFIGETFSFGRPWVRRAAKRLFLPIFFRRIEKIVSLSDKNLAFYRQHLRLPESKVVTSKFAVNVKFFQLPSGEASSTRARVRTELGIPLNAFVILFVGRLFYRKRPWDILQIHKLISRHRDVHTVLIGNGQLEESLRVAAAAEISIRLVGFKDQSETRDYYHASDVLVVPSEFETWSAVVSEAFAAGIPAVVTDQCGVAGDLVLDGQTGYIFRVGDISAAAKRIEELMDNPALRMELAKKARARVQAGYDVGQAAGAILKAREQIVLGSR